MEPWSFEPAGRFEETLFESEALRGNPLGDPSERPLWVYVPPGYDDEPERRYPSVYMIQGLTGQLDMWRNRTPFRRNFPELADELFASGGAPPAIVVWVDAWTSLGGSQFLDSPGTGNYHTYLCDEVVPWVDASYRTLAGAAHRGIAGKSSGGYGAMVTPMLRPDLFGGLATHAGDALFETCYLPEFREVARALRDDYEGSYERFWEDFRSRPALSKPSDGFLLNSWCMAACYSADPDGTVRLPFDVDTGELVPGGVGALARVGPGADGAGARGGAPLPEGDLHRRRQARRVLPRPRRRGLPPGAGRASGSRTSTSSSSTPRTWRSSTATRSASPTWPSGSRPRRARRRGRRGARGGRARGAPCSRRSGCRR